MQGSNGPTEGEALPAGSGARRAFGRRLGGCIMGHIVLLGDSIFDNASYVPEGPPVVTQLRHRLPKNWRASLLAVDGHRTMDVMDQLTALPGDATHLIVSVGGNDALSESVSWITLSPRWETPYDASKPSGSAFSRPTMACSRCWGSAANARRSAPCMMRCPA